MIVPFNPIHLKYIDLQDTQAYMGELLQDQDYIDLLMMDEGYSYIHNGEVLCCSGVYPMTETIGRAWLLLSKNVGKQILPVTSGIRDFLLRTQYDRIETPVRRDFTNGHRWVKVLKFINETPAQGMKYYGIEGETYDLYAFFPREHHNEQVKPIQETQETKG